MSRREVMTQPETDMRATALWTVLLLPLLLLLSACSGSDHQEPQVEAPSPPISARGNPAQELDGMRRHVPVDVEEPAAQSAKLEAAPN